MLKPVRFEYRYISSSHCFPDFTRARNSSFPLAVLYVLSFPFSSTSSCSFLCYGSWSSNHHFSLECERQVQRVKSHSHTLSCGLRFIGWILSFWMSITLVELRVQLEKALMVFPLSAENLLHETQLLSRLLYFARFGWTQTRVLKFRGRKNTREQLIQARTWNPWQGGFTCSQHAIQKSSFLQPPILLSVWKQKWSVTEGWALLTRGRRRVMPQTAPPSMNLYCIVLHCLLEMMHSQLHGKQRPVGDHGKPHGFLSFANLVGESLWLLT